jgi:hypothetical protein
MERAAERPRFHEQPGFPERLAHVGLADLVDSQRELQLCGRLNLSVHAPKVVSDIRNSIGGRSDDEG